MRTPEIEPRHRRANSVASLKHDFPHLLSEMEKHMVAGKRMALSSRFPKVLSEIEALEEGEPTARFATVAIPDAKPVFCKFMNPAQNAGHLSTWVPGSQSYQDFIEGFLPASGSFLPLRSRSGNRLKATGFGLPKDMKKGFSLGPTFGEQIKSLRTEYVGTGYFVTGVGFQSVPVMIAFMVG